MRTWTRKSSLGGPKLRSEIDVNEEAVLRSLIESVRGMLADRADSAPQDPLAELTGMRTGCSKPPEEAALARLLPDFHKPDPRDDGGDLNGALRSLHEPEIIDAKCEAADVVLRTLPSGGGKIVLTMEQADAWLAALNDVRLALGSALEIEPDMPEELDEGDPRAPHLPVYHWLTWMQDSLIQALMKD